MLKYQRIYKDLKLKIQQGEYASGDLLPSENELCSEYAITRTTSRKALDELLKEGFIEKKQGLGSIVVERRKSLGLLNIKGFSEAGGENVKTIFLQKPALRSWSDEIKIKVSEEELRQDCIHFERLRYMGTEPVMLESNWFADLNAGQITQTDFVDDSFFKTLSQKYLIEIIGSEHELRAEFATPMMAKLLKVNELDPLLHVSIKFITSKAGFHTYAELYCNTEKYPISGMYNTAFNQKNQWKSE